MAERRNPSSSSSSSKNRSPRSIGIAVKSDDPKASAAFAQLEPLFKIYHRQNPETRLYVESEESKSKSPRLSGRSDLFTPCSMETLVSKSELLLSLGGDGTLLRCARYLLVNDDWKKTLLLGINAGHLGFLTFMNLETARELLPQLLQQKLSYEIEKRTCLKVRIQKKKQKAEEIHCLNDVALNKGSISRLFESRVSLNGHFLSSYRSDGLIVSTPTGSTAYNLAAGGSILAPNIAAIQLTPICPHSLSNKPIVVSDSETIELSLGKHSSDVFLTLDGHRAIQIESTDKIVIERSPKVIQLLIPKVMGTSHYLRSLRQKLGWGSSN